MKIIHQEERTEDRVLVLGTFDGVHRGHAELIRQGLQAARESGLPLQVCTFDRHPMTVIRPETQIPLLTTGDEKLRRLEELGADEIRILTFSRETAATAPEEFLSLLWQKTRMKTVIAGWNYTFGKGGAGNAETLRKDGESRGYQTRIVPAVYAEDGSVISSTRIRETLQEGRTEEANGYLGYAYRITGRVMGGKHLGSRIGYPTANIETDPAKLLPAFGVYLCLLEANGDRMPALVNIGTQPTIPSGRVTVEAHALYEAPELYGTVASVHLMKRIRGEIRFGSVEELKDRIARDREEAIRYFEKTEPEP